VCSPQIACATLFHVRGGFHYKFWVYILSSRSSTFYIGITGYFGKRIHQHQYGSIEGFTKKY
jgi:predicted GIY-YIG superfamily endonuclease